MLYKFEYFLNSNIIGGRIKNPMWLTLLGLLIGERLAGIRGMILAPVLPNYLKLIASQIDAARWPTCILQFPATLPAPNASY